MLRVCIYRQGNRVAGTLKFRLRDGNTQLYHTTNITASAAELETLNPDGTIKARIRNANVELSDRIQAEMNLCREVYIDQLEKGARLTTAAFEEAIDRRKYPAKYIAQESNRETIIERLITFTYEAARFNVIGGARSRQYKTTINQLSAYLKGAGKSRITADDFTARDLTAFRDYLMNDRGLKQNTVVTRLKVLQTFYRELEDTGEIDKSPFRGVSKSVRRAMMRETVGEPVYLTPDELCTVAATEVPKTLRECKECFLLHCKIGARVADFRRLTPDNLRVSEDGIPYVRYIPSKTERTGQVVETPLTRSALETIKRTGFDFRLLNYVSGQLGYNVKIKKLLEVAGITRPVTITEEGKKVEVPICGEASSKIARKTYVSALARVQVNAYASGLHKVGSSAVNHYYSETLRDRFILTCAAFGEPMYRVDKELNVISV